MYVVSFNNPEIRFGWEKRLLYSRLYYILLGLYKLMVPLGIITRPINWERVWVWCNFLPAGAKFWSEQSVFYHSLFWWPHSGRMRSILTHTHGSPLLFCGSHWPHIIFSNGLDTVITFQPAMCRVLPSIKHGSESLLLLKLPQIKEYRIGLALRFFLVGHNWIVNCGIENQ